MGLENLIHGLTVSLIIGLPMITLCAIIFNVVKNHAIIVITLVWSFLFSFINLSSLMDSIHSNMKPYLLWFNLIVDFNLDAWVSFLYFLLIFIASIKTIIRTIHSYK